MRHVFFSFFRDEDGQGLADYGLILALVSVVCLSALTQLGGNIQGVMAFIQSHLPQ